MPFPTLSANSKRRAMTQAGANTESAKAVVKATYADPATGNITAADVLVKGQVNALVRVPNVSGYKLTVGDSVEMRFVNGNKHLRQIVGGAGSTTAATAAAGASPPATILSPGQMAGALTGHPFLLQSADASIPGGYVETPGANVSFTDTPGTADGYVAGTRVVSAPAIVLTVLPNPLTTTLPHGTKVDLVDSYGNPLGLYRLDTGMHLWRRRDAGGGSTATVFGPSGTGHSTGLVPDPGSTAGASRFLCENGNWQSAGTAIVPAAASGYQALLQVCGLYQATPGTISLTAAPLLTDNSAGDTASGYKGVNQSSGSLTNKGTANTTSMVARYLLNATSGTTEMDNVSSPANDLTTSGTVTYGSDSTGGNYIQFGTGGYASTTSALLTGTGDFTIEVVINDDTTSQNNTAVRIFTPGDDATLVFVIQTYMSATQRQFGLYSAGGTGGSSISMYDTARSNGLAYYTYVWNSSTSTATLYKNGTQINTATTASFVRNTGTGKAFCVGGNASTTGYNSPYPHYLVSVFNKAMTTSEVSARYTAAVSAACLMTTLLDVGALGLINVTQIDMTRSWVNTLTEVLEYSNDAATWTAIPIGYTPVSHGGTVASVRTTVTLGATVQPRYVRYSGKDTGGTGNQFTLTDFRIS